MMRRSGREIGEIVAERLPRFHSREAVVSERGNWGWRDVRLGNDFLFARS
jgi:hypothetical protein